MSAARGTSGRRSTTAKTILLGVAATLVLVIVGGGGVWTMMCPCETTPGFVLLGDSHADPVTDWSFANDVSLCQIPDQHHVAASRGERELHGDAGGRSVHQLLVRRQQVLVPSRRRGSAGSPAAGWRGLSRPAQPRAGPAHVGSGLGRSDREVAEGGGAGPAARRWRSAALARHSAAGQLVVVSRRLALLTAYRVRPGSGGGAGQGRGRTSPPPPARRFGLRRRDTEPVPTVTRARRSWAACHCTGQPDTEPIALRYGRSPTRFWVLPPPSSRPTRSC